MKYIWDKKTRKWVSADQYRRSAPKSVNIIGDIDPYRSIIDGSVISSRSTHRAHMRRHDVEEAGNEKIYEKPKPAYVPTGIPEDIKRAYEELGG